MAVIATAEISTVRSEVDVGKRGAWSVSHNRIKREGKIGRIARRVENLARMKVVASRYSVLR